MIKSEWEKAYYRILSRVRKAIEARFSQLEEFGLRFIRAKERTSSQDNPNHTNIQHILNDEVDLMGTRVRESNFLSGQHSHYEIDLVMFTVQILSLSFIIILSTGIMLALLKDVF